jgi:hypothetical protein
MEAMRACPEGKRLEQYAKEVGACRSNVEKAAAMCFDYGQVVRARAGLPMLWTAAEHAEALKAGVEKEKARQRAALEESGVIAARKAQTRARRKRNQNRYRAEKRKARPPKQVGPARYSWPEPVQWVEPVIVRSVWDLVSV